jgi:hypothetical protein
MHFLLFCLSFVVGQVSVKGGGLVSGFPRFISLFPFVSSLSLGALATFLLQFMSYSFVLLVVLASSDGGEFGVSL